MFVLLRVLPGDPYTAALGGRLSAAQIEQRKEAAGLNDPILEQYWDYLSGVATGDFGQPATDSRTVTELIGDLLPATIELTAFAMVLAVVLGVVLGAIGARFRDGPLDVGGRFFGILIYAAPVFWLGILAQLVFARWLGWLPTGNRISARIDALECAGLRLWPDDCTGLYLLDALRTWDLSYLWTTIRHLILPGTTLGLVISGVFIRIVRVNMLQTLRADYVESARARGVSDRRVLFRHALKNALVPVVTVMGLQFALLLGGAILTETTFSWPGMGSALVRYINDRDFVAVQGLVTVIAILIVAVSLLIDLLNGLIDPRVRY